MAAEKSPIHTTQPPTNLLGQEIPALPPIAAAYLGHLRLTGGTYPGGEHLTEDQIIRRIAASQRPAAAEVPAEIAPRPEIVEIILHTMAEESLEGVIGTGSKPASAAPARRPTMLRVSVQGGDKVTRPITVLS